MSNFFKPMGYKTTTHCNENTWEQLNTPQTNPENLPALPHTPTSTLQHYTTSIRKLSLPAAWADGPTCPFFFGTECSSNQFLVLVCFTCLQNVSLQQHIGNFASSGCFPSCIPHLEWRRAALPRPRRPRQWGSLSFQKLSWASRFRYA